MWHCSAVAIRRVAGGYVKIGYGNMEANTLIGSTCENPAQGLRSQSASADEPGPRFNGAPRVGRCPEPSTRKGDCHA